MAPKRPKSNFGVEKQVKRARSVMPLEQKVEVLDRLASGESAASVGRSFGVNESTIRTIRKAEAIVRAKYRSSTNLDDADQLEENSQSTNCHYCKKEADEIYDAEPQFEPDISRIPVRMSTPWSMSSALEIAPTSQRTVDATGRSSNMSHEFSVGNGELEMDSVDNSFHDRLSSLEKVVFKLSQESNDGSVLLFLSKKMVSFSEHTQQWVEDEVLKIYMEAKKRELATRVNSSSRNVQGVCQHSVD